MTSDKNLSMIQGDSLIRPVVLDRARHYLARMPQPTAAERMPRRFLLTAFVGKYAQSHTKLLDTVTGHTDEVLDMIFRHDQALLDKLFSHSPELLRHLFWLSDAFLLDLFRHESRTLEALFIRSHFALSRLLRHSDTLLRRVAAHSDETLYMLFHHDDMVLEAILKPGDSVLFRLFDHDQAVVQRILGHSSNFYLTNLFAYPDPLLAKLFDLMPAQLLALFGLDDYLLESLFSIDADAFARFLQEMRNPQGSLPELTHRYARKRMVAPARAADLPKGVADAFNVIVDPEKRGLFASLYQEYRLRDPALISTMFSDPVSLQLVEEKLSADDLADFLALPPDVLKAIFGYPPDVFRALFRHSDTLLSWLFMYPSFVTRTVFMRTPEFQKSLFDCPEELLRKLFRHHDTVLEKMFRHSDAILERVFAHQPETLDWLFSLPDRLLWDLFCHSEAMLSKIFSLDEGKLALTVLCSFDDARLHTTLARGDDELKQMFSQVYTAPTESITAGSTSLSELNGNGDETRRLRLDIMPVPTGGASETNILLRAMRRESVADVDLLDLVFSHNDTVLGELFGLPNTTLMRVLSLPPARLRELFWYPDRTLHALFLNHDTLVQRAFFSLGPHTLHRVLATADGVLEEMLSHSDHVLLRLLDSHDAVLIELFSHSADVLHRIFRLPDQTLRELFLCSNTMLWEMFLRSDAMLEKLFSCPPNSLEALFFCDKPLLEDLFSWEDDVLVELVNMLNKSATIDLAETLRRLLSQTRIVDAEFSVSDSEIRDARARQLVQLAGEKAVPFRHYYGKYADVRPALIELVFSRDPALHARMMECGTNIVWHILSLPPGVLAHFFQHDDATLAVVLSAPDIVIERLSSTSPLVMREIFRCHSENLRRLFSHSTGVLNCIFSQTDAVLVELFRNDAMLLQQAFSLADDTLRHVFNHDSEVIWGLLLQDPSILSRLFEADDDLIAKLFTQERNVLAAIFAADSETFRDYVGFITHHPGSDFRATAEHLLGARTIMVPEYFAEGEKLLMATPAHTPVH